MNNGGHSFTEGADFHPAERLALRPADPVLTTVPSPALALGAGCRTLHDSIQVCRGELARLQPMKWPLGVAVALAHARLSLERAENAMINHHAHQVEG